MKKIILLAFCSIFLTGLSCTSTNESPDAWNGLKSYTGKESLAWYAELERLPRGESFESEALKAMEESELSDEAFNRLCALLKYSAGERSVEALKKYLNSENRVVSACEVIAAVGGEKAESALREALTENNCAQTLMFSLSNFGKSEKNIDAFESIYLSSESPALKESAIMALGSAKNGKKAVEVLCSLYASSKDFKKSLEWAIAKQASNLIKSGNADSAKEALCKLPDGTPCKTSLLAKTKSKRELSEFLESRLLADSSDFPEAARASNNAFNFENSTRLVKKFPSASKRQKLAFISLFCQSGDPKFYPTIEPEILSSDSDIRSEAVFAARFLADKPEQIEKILTLSKSDKPEDSEAAKIAQKVLEENPFPATDEVLKKDSENLGSLQTLIKRGDKSAYLKLEKMFFDNPSDRKIAMLFENSITLGELKEFLKNYKKYDDPKTKAAIAKVAIKTLAKLRSNSAIEQCAEEAVGDSIPPDDKNFALLENKLKIVLPQGKKVWQKEYFKRAVSDDKMKVAKLPEPDLGDGFEPIFDGKTLKGWHISTGNATYEVKDGAIVGTTDPNMRKNSFLLTDRKDYKDFIFTCEFKWIEPGNSGVIFRGKAMDDGTVCGPQCEMDDSPRAWTGGIYNETVKWVYSLSREDHKAAREAVKLDGWNRMTIYCVGDTIRTWINGVPVADLEWNEYPKGGFFGLQIHVGKSGKVAWRNIKVKEIK